MAWTIRAVLGILILVIPAHQFALHFYFSAKGSLLSSGLAIVFAFLLTWSLKSKRTQGRDALISLSPFVLIGSLYLVMPSQLNLLYSLVVTLAFSAFVLQPKSQKILAGGRSELIFQLHPFTSVELGHQLLLCFILLSIFSFIAHLIFTFTHVHIAALVPYCAIAVSSAAVQNRPDSKES